MRSPRQVPPVCCDRHIHRFLPVPENPLEELAVRAVGARWDEEFYFVGEHSEEGDGRRTTEDLPLYVVALLPGATS